MKRLLLFTPLAFALVTSCSVIDKISGSGNSCSGPVVYTAGASTAGAIGSSGCKGPTGITGQLYSMTLSQETNIQLTVTTTAFKPFLGLYTAAGKVISEASVDGKLNAFLPAGSYQVLVAKASGNDGSFTLSSPTYALGGCSSTTGTWSDGDVGNTVRGAAFSGSVTAADCGAANAKLQVYVVRLVTGDTLTTSVTVDHAAGLYLVGPDGVTIVDKEMADAGMWTDTYVAKADGVHALHVESRTANGSSNLPLGYSVILK